MEHTQELVKALAELKRITGITMDVTADSPEEAEQALTQIRCLCTAYKEKYNKSDFLQGLMTGGIPAYDIAERAARLHINPDERRILFLLEAKEIDELNNIKDLLKYLDNINENNFSVLEITATKEIKQKIEELIKLGNTVFFATKQENENIIDYAWEKFEKRKYIKRNMVKQKKCRKSIYNS